MPALQLCRARAILSTKGREVLRPGELPGCQGHGTARLAYLIELVLQTLEQIRLWDTKDVVSANSSTTAALTKTLRVLSKNPATPQPEDKHGLPQELVRRGRPSGTQV